MGQQDQTEQSHNDAFAPFLGRAAQEAGQDGNGRHDEIPPPASGRACKAGRGAGLLGFRASHEASR
jgi:hypothetical protein